MKKVLSLLLLFLTLSVAVFAKSRNASDAQQLAAKFYKNIPQTRSDAADQSLQLVYTCPVSDVATKNGDGDAAYYIFNVGDDGGFIIVSGDDRANEILGYSTENGFDTDRIPDNFRYWLSCYQQEMQGLVATPEQDPNLIVYNPATEIRATGGHLNPLLGHTTWDQGNPYNLLCPEITVSGKKTRTAVGCLATALAQIMYYYQWPAKGTGSNSYTTDEHKINLSVNFANSTYNWSGMTPTYGSSSTTAAKNAVAKLMYDCGVAMDMDYGESSGASFTAAAAALTTYFGYDSSVQLYMRDYFSMSEWKAMLKSELDAKRPVLYGGSAAKSAHAFVCDGYDSNELFHINWGWSGVSNGYFALTALTPGVQGIGGSDSGYNFGQNMTLGIRKPSSTPLNYKSHVVLKSPMSPSKSSVGKSEQFELPMVISNYGANTFNGYFAIGLVDSKSSVTILQRTRQTTLDPWYYGTVTYEPHYGGVTEGTYKLYAFSSPDGINWTIANGLVGTPQYLNVQVGASTVTMSSSTDLPTLKLNSSALVGNFYNKKTGRVKVSVTNNGKGDYNSNLMLYVVGSKEEAISEEPVYIAVGETQEITLTGSVTQTPGSYQLYVMYDKNANRSNASYTNFDSGKAIEVKTAPVGEPTFAHTKKISFANNSAVNGKNMKLKTSIRNTGNYFEGDMIAFVFASTGGTSLTFFGYQSPCVDTNETALIEFAGSTTLGKGNYQTVVYYYSTQKSNWIEIGPENYSRLSFTVTDDGTALDPVSVQGVRGKVYPNPATDKVYLDCAEKVLSVNVYDLSGRRMLTLDPQQTGVVEVPVDKLPKGTYLLQFNTPEGVGVEKFIKK